MLSLHTSRKGGLGAGLMDAAQRAHGSHQAMFEGRPPLKQGKWISHGSRLGQLLDQLEKISAPLLASQSPQAQPVHALATRSRSCWTQMEENRAVV